MTGKFSCTGGRGRCYFIRLVLLFVDTFPPPNSKVSWICADTLELSNGGRRGDDASLHDCSALYGTLELKHGRSILSEALFAH